MGSNPILSNFVLKKIKFLIFFNKKQNFIVIINNRIVNIKFETLILKIGLYLNYKIPCLCYNEFLNIAGNCRICLVENNLSKKLVTACSTLVMNGMFIWTKNKRINEVREYILEFILLNHPLDCPICDQGGECDLQDFTLIFGNDRGRFFDGYKKSVEIMNLGFLIKFIITRCIYCTRCIRFSREINDFLNLGILGRTQSFIGNYLKTNIYSWLSGMIIDLCPVGFFKL